MPGQCSASELNPSSKECLHPLLMPHRGRLPAQPLIWSFFFLLQALGSFYFLHESLKNIYQFDFKGKSPC